jgi:hypothetical protein
MNQHPRGASTNVIAGLICTAMAFCGGGFYLAVALGWIDKDDVEPIVTTIVGTAAVAITAGALWLLIRYINRH